MWVNLLKKIAIFTMGTRGDVQPYIYLAQTLNQSGFEVIIGSHPCWRELIERSGILFAPIGPNIDIENEAAIIRGKIKNPVMSMLKTMNFVFRIIQNSSHDIYKTCEGKDLIIVSHSLMGAIEAEVLEIPTVNVTLQTEMIPEKLIEKKWKSKLIGNIIAAQVAKPYNKIRKIYGLSKIQSADEIVSKTLNLIPISNYVKEKNPYWEKQHIMTGYWYVENKQYQPDEKIINFLSSGDKPIILALGAMSFESNAEEEKLDIFINAFLKTGNRAIIQGFQKSLQDYKLPDSMISIGSVPHSWLFRQGYCVIHHCGFGTTAASLIYGIPTIPVPHVLDQFGLALQLSELGVAVSPIRAKDLNEGKLTEAIVNMKNTYDEKKKRVTELSGKMQAENGLQKSVDMIREIISG